MKKIPRWLLIAAAAAVVLIVAVLIFTKRSGATSEPDAAPTAAVTVAPVQQGAVADVAPAFGSVQPAAGETLTVASPRAAVILRIFAGVGQAVRAGEPLFELANSPATQQAFKQAEDAQAFAERDLARLQRLLTEHLATTDQVSTAQKTLADARAALAAQQAQGANRSLQVVTAPAAAVVTSVTAAPGDRVAQDAVLMVLARAGGLVAKLSIEPSDAPRVTPGAAVTLTPVFGGAPVSTRIGAVGRQADPATRAIDAVAPLHGEALPVGGAVQAEIRTGSHQGLTVPRGAVVFDETGPHLFTIAAGKAHRVFVAVGADHGEVIEVRGDLRPGTLVAVQGAYELQDGMAVRTGRR